MVCKFNFLSKILKCQVKEKTLGKRFRNQNVSDGHQMEQKQFVSLGSGIHGCLPPLPSCTKEKVTLFL